MAAKFRLLGEAYEAAPVARQPQLELAINGDRCCIDALDTSALERGQVRVTIDGVEYLAQVARGRNEVFLHVDGETWSVETVDPVAAAGGGAAASDSILAPMPGLVVAAAVGAGACVSEGEALLVIESMKLQTTIISDRAGRVAELPVGAGESFDKGVELVRFEHDDGDSGS